MEATVKMQHMTRLTNWYARTYSEYQPQPPARSTLDARYRQRQRNRRKRRR
jgi:hypothetical protein